METGGQSRQKSLLFLIIAIFAAFIIGLLIWWVAQWAVMQNVRLSEGSSVSLPSRTTESPNLTAEVLVGGRSHIWDVAFLPTKELLFTERTGTLSIRRDTTIQTVATIPDVVANGEGGLLGLAVDPVFSENRLIYTCYNTAKDIRVVRWRLADDGLSLAAKTDIITGIPANPSGRHSGCRLAFGPDGQLWVGTGDAADGKQAQDPKTLGGKILRVDRDGKPSTGNLGGTFDPRIYSYGHRNTQGLAFSAAPIAGNVGVSVEHGSDIDDEVNFLKPGNFGWAPPPSGYNEDGVAMTDLARFPDSVQSIWKSGSPTQALSGASFVTGNQWKGWNGALAVAVLKSQHLKILQLDANGGVVKEEKVITTFGRLRSVTQGPDGNLYITTDNGANDQILRIVPS